MLLTALLKKKTLVIVGVNSGTSADGVDLAALKFTTARGKVGITCLDSQKKAYPPDIKKMIIQTAVADKISLDKIIQFDNLLGRYYGRSARSFINRLKHKGVRADAVASHGQTVRHLPQKIKNGRKLESGTLQLGSLDQIAATTGLVTVGDFRQADIALGREGAPITVAAVEKLFARPDESRLIVNIGGIANFFYFPRKKLSYCIQAADCGPGNSLLDLLAEKLFRKKFDKNGKIARRGDISTRLLSLLLSHPFLKQKRISTGREEFGPAMVEKIIDFGRRFKLHRDDLIATAAEFTVLSIIEKIRPLIQKDQNLSKLYLTGGGEKNMFLKSRLRQYLPDIKIDSVKALGIGPDIVEAASYAVMGHACLRGECLRTDFSGKAASSIQPVLGKIVQPPGMIKI